MGPYLLLFALFLFCREDNPYSHDNVGHWDGLFIGVDLSWMDRFTVKMWGFVCGWRLSCGNGCQYLE
jgi:hypothetical protein